MGNILTHKSKLIGGIGNNNYEKQYCQGNRVYDPNGIACTLTANGGGYGRHCGLILVEKNAQRILHNEISTN